MVRRSLSQRTDNLVHKVGVVARENVQVISRLKRDVTVLRKADGDENISLRQLLFLDQNSIHQIHAREAGSVELFHI